MKKLSVAVALVLAVALVFAAPLPASADASGKAVNTLSNVVLGWTNCPKAWVDEGMKWSNPVRGMVGVLVSGPIMCVLNVGATYLGVAADVVTLPWDGNVLPPAAHASVKPPLTLKE